MSSFNELLQAGTCRFNNKIKKTCAPLFEFLNLNEFWYFKISNAGFSVYFGSNPGWAEYYASQKFYLRSPFHCHPKFYSEGICVLRSMLDQEDKKYFKAGCGSFDTYPGLLLINRISDGVEGFGFSSPSCNEVQLRMLLCELPLLKLFSEKFKEENASLFSVLDDHQINLAEVMGPVFYQNRFAAAFPNRSAQRAGLLEKMGVTGRLTAREVEVIKLVLLGYSSGKIAPQIYLSKRTVEHHIERIKLRLGCDSKAELIQKARELERLGFLNG